jgi:protein SCO1
MRADTWPKRVAAPAGFTARESPTKVVSMSILRAFLSLALLLGSTACTRTPSYEVVGQIVAMDPARQEITVKHGDIKGFMPAMTMAYKVKDGRLIAGKQTGDLIRATLVVEDSLGYFTKIEVTGHAPLTEPPPSRTAFDILAPGQMAPDVRLVGQDGTERHLSDWRGRVVAVTFIYTRCPLPDFCPLMDRHFAVIQREALADAPLKERLRLLSVTLDPSFDTPPILLAHARRVGADPGLWSFATGTPEDLDRFGSRFGVTVMRNDPSGSEVVHNLRTAVLDPEGRLTTIFGGNDWGAADLLKELRRVAGNN